MEKLKVALSELTDKQKDTVIKKFYRGMINVQIAPEGVACTIVEVIDVICTVVFRCFELSHLKSLPFFSARLGGGRDTKRADVTRILRMKPIILWHRF